MKVQQENPLWPHVLSSSDPVFSCVVCDNTAGSPLADSHAPPPYFPRVRGTPASADSSGKAFCFCYSHYPSLRPCPPFRLSALVWLPSSLALPPLQGLSAQGLGLAPISRPSTHHAGELILPPALRTIPDAGSSHTC